MNSQELRAEIRAGNVSVYRMPPMFHPDLLYGAAGYGVMTDGPTVASVWRVIRDAKAKAER
jgi:hypothetical protein